MRSPCTKCWRLLVMAVVMATAWAPRPSVAGDAYKWSVQYLIDNSCTVFGRPQKVSPRHNRGLAISPDARHLYAGYEHGFNNFGEIRRIRIDVSSDYERATEAVLSGVQGKALATDDKGRVYICDQKAVLVYDAMLARRELEIPAADCAGVAAVREGAQLILYVTRRDQGTISRFILQESGDDVTAATLSGFDGHGVFTIPEASDLHGVKADGRGNLWLTDWKGGKVFRVTVASRLVKSAPISGAFDLAVDDGRIFVSRGAERLITVLDPELGLIGTLEVPWQQLELSPEGSSRNGALSGIVVVPGKGLFVANEAGQTLDRRSTYGQFDDHSGEIDGKRYRDIFQEDKDPILRATEVDRGP